MKTSSATAAAAERKLATCQLLIAVALMPAPPVENSVAAASSCKRALIRSLIVPSSLIHAEGSENRDAQSIRSSDSEDYATQATHTFAPAARTADRRDDRQRTRN